MAVNLCAYDQLDINSCIHVLMTRWALMAVYLCANDQVDINGCIPVC